MNMIKKLVAVLLTAAMMLSLTVCALGEAPAVKWQLVGTCQEEGQGAERVTAAFLVELYEDGTVSVDRYRYLVGDNSDVAENTAYDAAFMVGTWEKVEKDGQETIQIDVHCVNESGEELHPYTTYVSENSGELECELSFPVILGMDFKRTVVVSGGEEIRFTDRNDFIADYYVAKTE